MSIPIEPIIRIREERRDDRPKIREVVRLAFGRDAEAKLVDRLRADDLVIASLVAIEDERVVGHAMFSALSIETDGRRISGAALAPVAVRPDWQNRGIGSALIRRGLDLCRERGQSVVIVVGDPTYYARFGFSSQLANTLHSVFSGDAFMALELTPGVLRNLRATVRYPEAFNGTEEPPAA